MLKQKQKHRKLSKVIHYGSVLVEPNPKNNILLAKDIGKIRKNIMEDALEEQDDEERSENDKLAA